MQISKRCEYALRALIDLGMAETLGHASVPVRRLAQFERISDAFLVQILLQMKEAGWLSSTRGQNGGYSLARPQREIRMGEVVRLMDGPLAPIRCVSQTEYERCSCPDEEHCGLRMLMLDVRNSIAGILDRTTLQQIVDITLRKIRRDRVVLSYLPDEK